MKKILIIIVLSVGHGAELIYLLKNKKIDF